jgi:hypothetical protein
MEDETKKVHETLVRSKDVSEIIENPAELYNMMIDFKSLNQKFNEIQDASRFIWKYKDPNFLRMTLAPTSGSEPRFSMSASIRTCDELLNITPVYFMPEEMIETYYLNRTFVKFIEIWREQLFRFALLISGGGLIRTRWTYEAYWGCHVDKNEFMRLYKKYNIPKGDDVEWDPEAQCHRSLQQILREEKENNEQENNAESI